MADSQSLKKNKKKKKKGASNTKPLTVTPSSHTATNGIDESITKTNSSISKNLPPKFAAAMFKDVEVTMSKCEVKNDVVPSVSSKKSKKKKSKKPTEVPAKENDSTGLLTFNENRIELVNHPEISVTLSKVPEVEDSQHQNSEKVTLLEEKPVEENSTAPAAKKKKKKKKKKKVTNEVPETVETAEDNAYTSPSPTYVKLPASGDSLVLVVSHESFSNGNKSSNNSGTDKGTVIQNGLTSVLPQNKKLINNVPNKNTSAFSSNFQQGNSVKIFPVPSNTEGESNSNNKQSLLNSSVIEKKVDSLVDNSRSNPSSEPVASSEPDATKTKAQLKAERRAIQEAQRAAKAKSKEKEVQSVPPQPVDSKSDPVSKEASLKKVGNPKIDPEKEKIKLVVKDVIHKVRLFSHLPKCKAFENLNDTHSQIHSAILEVGYQYSKGIICGSNARCIALLAALRKAINDSAIIPDKDFLRSLETKLQVYLNFLSSCRPLSVSMINAVKFLKHQMNHLPKELSEIKVKENLSNFISNFVNEEILLAKEAIGDSASAKIVNGDVILVFAYSSLVKDVLCKAHNQEKVFRVIVVDSRPKMEGLKMLRCLVKQGLHCSYISISAISYVMKEVSKVIIGAHALLSNGCVMSRLGCKQVALVASSYSVPVLVCCETYKFCERVLTDSFVHNELGETEKLLTSNHVQNDCLKNLNDLHSLQLLNLLYDVTPPDLISMVITEKGVLPCTSVPVVLRVRHAGLHE